MSKYCIKAVKDKKCLDLVEEISIEYHGDRSLGSIRPFLDMYSNHDIVLSIEAEYFSDKLFELLDIINEKYVNLKLCLTSIPEKEKLEKIKKYKKIPYFFYMPAHTYDDFYSLMNLGVSEIYVGVELGFELNKIWKVAYANNIILRAIPNYAMTLYKDFPFYLKFFIRPEDLDEYNKYIDTFEFEGTPSMMETLINAYIKNKKWYGDLSEIIIGLKKDELDSRYVFPIWYRRATCGRQCLKGSSCRLCSSVKETEGAFKLAEVDIPTELNAIKLLEYQESRFKLEENKANEIIDLNEINIKDFNDTDNIEETTKEESKQPEPNF